MARQDSAPAVRGLIALLSVVCALVSPSGAFAQTPPGPPGPYVIDLRGTTSNLSRSASFYPELPQEATIPGRGFGFDVGGHVYLLRLAGARVGIGANYLQMRGTATDANAMVRTLAPQLSFNFGSAQGWSYLSAGLGTARVRTELTSVPASPATPVSPGTSVASAATVETERESSSLSSLNFGGGARWFVNRRFAFGFDVRFHRLADGTAGDSETPTPKEMLVSVSVGISIR